ncbi:MAG TPA: hypothetical protein VK474_06870 [Chthoniobacterales bacterium]|nr:hypothetical protein [Chthoniobacterales bacterium]
MSDSLIFTTHPDVTIATNRFIQVPIILMFEETPLLEVEKVPEAGFTTKYSIYHSDGTHLAKVVGARLFATEDGTKAGVTLRHPEGMTVCELGGNTLFEIRRSEAAALKTQAELWSPTGQFIKATDVGLAMFKEAGDKDALKIGGITMSDCTFQGCSIGIHLTRNGVRIGVNRPKA